MGRRMQRIVVTYRCSSRGSSSSGRCPSQSRRTEGTKPRRRKRVEETRRYHSNRSHRKRIMTQQTIEKHRVSAGRHWGLLLGTALMLWGLTGAAVQTDKTTLESLAVASGLGTPLSYNAVVSANGRIVAFTSKAINLVTDDTNGTYDIFVHDCKTGQTTRISV